MRYWRIILIIGGIVAINYVLGQVAWHVGWLRPLVVILDIVMLICIVTMIVDSYEALPDRVAEILGLDDDKPVGGP